MKSSCSHNEVRDILFAGHLSFASSLALLLLLHGAKHITTQLVRLGSHSHIDLIQRRRMYLRVGFASKSNWFEILGSQVLIHQSLNGFHIFLHFPKTYANPSIIQFVRNKEVDLPLVTSETHPVECSIGI